MYNYISTINSIKNGRDAIDYISKLNKDHIVPEILRIRALIHLKLNEVDKYKEFILIAAVDNIMAQYEVGCNMIDGKHFFQNVDVGIGYLNRCKGAHLLANYKLGIYYYDLKQYQISKVYLTKFIIQTENTSSILREDEEKIDNYVNNAMLKINSMNEEEELNREKRTSIKITKVKQLITLNDSVVSVAAVSSDYEKKTKNSSNEIITSRSGKNPSKTTTSEEEDESITSRSGKNSSKTTISEEEDESQTSRSGKNPSKKKDNVKDSIQTLRKKKKPLKNDSDEDE
jgi:hypothetical protein